MQAGFCWQLLGTRSGHVLGAKRVTGLLQDTIRKVPLGTNVKRDVELFGLTCLVCLTAPAFVTCIQILISPLRIVLHLALLVNRKSSAGGSEEADRNRFSTSTPVVDRPWDPLVWPEL
jgi:hypothetical protein